MPTEEALNLAKESDMDLVVISKGGNDTVAKIIDFSKFKYIQNKKKKGSSKSSVVKEWWFKPKIEDHDINIKLKKAKTYLEKGAKVKITVRSIRRTTRDDMYNTLERVLELSKEFAEKASDINKEGRNLSVFLKYKKNKDEKQDQIA